MFSLGKWQKTMFCSFRLGLKMISEFHFEKCSLMFIKLDWSVPDLKSKVQILLICPLRTKPWTLDSAELQESNATSGISQSVKVVCDYECQTFPRPYTVWDWSIVSMWVMLVFSWPAAFCPQSPRTSDSSCLCFSCRGWAHNKMLKLITHINASALFTASVYMNELQWLIYNATFNPVLCT